jgi:phosphotransferase family enzyme
MERTVETAKAGSGEGAGQSIPGPARADLQVEELPHDPALPGLGRAVDTGAMLALLQPHFAVEMRALRLHHVHWKQGRSVWLAYEIDLGDPALAWRHYMAACALAKGTHALYGTMEARPWIEPRWGPALQYNDELDLCLWGFPNDPLLPGLGAVAQPEGLRAVLEGAPGVRGRVGTLRASEVVKYVPRKRLVMRHTTDRTVVYTKTHADTCGRAVGGFLQRLVERSRDDPHAFQVPEPIGYLEAERTLVQEGLVGWEPVEKPPADPEAFGTRVGRALARFHTSGLQGLERSDDAYDLEHLLEAITQIARFAPQLETQLAEFGRNARLAAPRNVGTAAPVHGSFRLRQLLTWEDRIGLVDFDDLRQGNPWRDLGDFLAELHTFEGLEDAHARRIRRAFFEAYAADVPWGVDLEALRWFTGVFLVSMHAKRYMRMLKNGRERRIPQFVDMAAEILAHRALPV